MLLLQNASYTHPDKTVLFSNLNLVVNPSEKIALIGNNGSGKSTLLAIIAGQQQLSSGSLQSDAKPYYIPQHVGQFDDWTVADALRITEQLKALHAILRGEVTEHNLTVLQDDWTLEERALQSLKDWNLPSVTLTQPMSSLSGGQKTSVFLAGLSLHNPALVLLDEPSNHLDKTRRSILYDWIQHTRSTLMVVSHDRTLLNLLNTTCELTATGIKTYGGNYDFYAAQKQIAKTALEEDIQHQEKEIRKAREKERASIARKQKLDARGKKKQEKAGVAKIMMNTLRNNAENSSARLKTAHAEKMEDLTQELQALRESVPETDRMKFGLENTQLHRGKELLRATGLQYNYSNGPLWRNGLDFNIYSGDRIALQGDNGSGKTTLLRLLLGSLAPESGTLFRAPCTAMYIDQDYSLLQNAATVFAFAQQFNQTGLEEHEIKIRLTRFLFTKADWDKTCYSLSGGERMRLLLCCLGMGAQASDLIILDEPTNNLDIQNIEILTAAISAYQGTVLVVSHDQRFLADIGITRYFHLSQEALLIHF